MAGSSPDWRGAGWLALSLANHSAALYVPYLLSPLKSEGFSTVCAAFSLFVNLIDVPFLKVTALASSATRPVLAALFDIVFVNWIPTVFLIEKIDLFQQFVMFLI